MKIVSIITNGPTLTGGLERICLRFAQHASGDARTHRIVCRFSERRHDLKGYFLDHEVPRVFHHERIEVATVAPVSWLGRLLLRPVFRLSWRKQTLGLAIRLYNLAMVRALQRACVGAELIHYYGTAQEMLGFAAREAALRLKVPFIIEPAVHPGQWGDFPSDLRLYRTADRILTHTRYEKEIIAGMGVDPSRIEVVTLGIDFGIRGNAAEFRNRHGLTGPVILFLGRKTVSKGIQRTTQAFAVVRERFPQAVLVVVGPAAGKEFQPGIPSVIDLDDVSEAEKADALAACDVLCLPSEGESFGMAYFEAWFEEKPVVALDLPSLHETVRDSGGGILVEDSPEAVANALIELLSDPDRSVKMGRSGARKAARHGWETAAESYRHIVNSLMEQRKTIVSQ